MLGISLETRFQLVDWADKEIRTQKALETDSSVREDLVNTVL